MQFLKSLFRSGKRCLSVADSGILAGFPVIDYKVTILDGLHHDVDSSVLAFEMHQECVSEACTKANLKLLEPMMKVEVVTPEEFMGDVIGDLNSRRASCFTEPRGNATAINYSPFSKYVWLYK